MLFEELTQLLLEGWDGGCCCCCQSIEYGGDAYSSLLFSLLAEFDIKELIFLFVQLFVRIEDLIY